MIISADTYIPFTRDLVYATYRDKLLELRPYMPNVRSIKVISHRQEAGLDYYVNQWQGGGDIPMAARAIINENLLTWDEYNTWNEADYTQEWYIKTQAFTEAVLCTGKNRFIAEENATRVQVRGELSIDAQKIKGFPSFMVGGIARVIEEFLGTKIGPNLVQMAEGVRQYLEKKPSKV